MRSSRHRRSARLSRQATALLEVILALALFVATAAVITSTLSAALDSLERQRLRLHAGNLAASVLAELQLGLRPAASTSAQPFDAPFDRWSCDIAILPLETDTGEASELSQVEVTVRHRDPDLVERLARVLPLATGNLRLPLPNP